MTNNEKLNAINALWGYTCYIKNDVVRLIDSNGVDRVPTSAEEVEIKQWVADKNNLNSQITTPENTTTNNIIYLDEDPKSDTNPESIHNIVINSKTGELFNCINSTINKNIWIGQLGTVIDNNYEIDGFDFFNDNSAIAFYKFDRNAHDDGGIYNGVPNMTRYLQHGTVYSLLSSSDTSITVNDLPFDDTTEVITVCAWLYWNGKYSTMPFGFSGNDMYVNNGYGFNTGNGDMIGISKTEFSTINKRKWAYHIITFKRDSTGSININGIEKAMTKTLGSRISPALFRTTFSILGWPNDRSYRDFGEVSRLRIINRELTTAEKTAIYSAELQNYGDIL